jgi:hypothetical protein
MALETVVEALTRLRSAEQFRPFELVFRNGLRAGIIWPEAVGWHAKHDQLSYAAPDDSFVHVPLSTVIEVRPLDGHG